MGKPSEYEESRGHQLLTELLERHFHGNQRGLAFALGVSDSAVSRWFARKTKPSAQVVVRLEYLFAIPAKAWAEPPTGKDPA